MSAGKKEMPVEKFDYLPPPREDFMFAPETFQDKMIRKSKENPFVLLGVGVTVFAVVRGLMLMRRGDSLRSQKMMRLRILGQGFSVLAILTGVLYSGYVKKKPNTNQ